MAHNTRLLHNFVKGNVREIQDLPNLDDSEVEDYINDTLAIMLYDFASHDASILLAAMKAAFLEMGLVIKVKVSVVDAEDEYQ